MLNLVTELIANGTAIDGIGFESEYEDSAVSNYRLTIFLLEGHFIVGEVPTTIAQSMEQFTALGLEVAVTELDIRMQLPETVALLEQQKADYQTVITACMSVEGCVGVTLWDYTDLYSWVPSTFCKYTLFHDNH
jgi:endo-1,4-beta-xylanase